MDRELLPPITPVPPEISLRTGTPVSGWAVSGFSDMLCFTSKRTGFSAADWGMVSYT